MTIAYVKEEKKQKFFQKSIEIRIFENNYVLAVIDKNKKNIVKKLIKYIQKLKIDTLVFSKDLENLKKEICDLDYVRIINGRKLMEYMEYNIFEYILEKQNNKIKEEDIYIVFKKDKNLDLNFLKIFIENFRMTNVVTNDVERLKNVQDNLIENDNILISVSNNKNKALKRAKYILNVNLTKEELQKYKINRNAIIVNIKEEVKYNDLSFEGVNVNNIELNLPDEYIERYEELGEKFDKTEFYESILLNDGLGKASIEEIENRINKDNVQIVGILGNNGEISDKELQKIHKINIDKKRKLV